ncbi:MAG: T9SS type A sorting domain-containing protein [Tannerella sp.]|jgi:hypothetical protein|nr:T9SS type A sorting domain-containing protein [Tannerella sp.]
MKKFILLLSLFPWLLSAQISENRIRKASIQWMDKPSVTNGVVLRTETVDNLPDSTYTYYDGELHRKVSIKYNEDGWVVLEDGYTDFDYDGLVDEDLKVEYTYTREDGFIVQDGISWLKFFNDGVWHTYARVVTRYNANGRPVRACSYFSLGNGEWELHEIAATVEYNEKGNPVVVMDSIPFGNELSAIGRHELYYDNFDRIAGYTLFRSGETEGEWLPREKVEITYDGVRKRTDTHFNPVENDGWAIDHLVETLYDERENIIAETGKEPDGDGKYTILWSDTYRHVYLSDGATSAIRPERSCSSVVYPNPSTNYVTISLQDADPAVVTIVDMSGRVVRRQTVEHQATIAVYSLPGGFYLLKVKTAKGTDVHKLVIK